MTLVNGWLEGNVSVISAVALRQRQSVALQMLNNYVI